MSNEITVEFPDRTMRRFVGDGSHYNGGRDWFGYGFRSVDAPRMRVIRKWYKGKRRGDTSDTFNVDGVAVADAAAALEALAKPPVFSAAEILALAEIGDEPADHRKVVDFMTLYTLTEKQAIKWGPPGRCCRTIAGRTALAEARRT